MSEFERIEKVSYFRIFTHNINKRKFMISCFDKVVVDITYLQCVYINTMSTYLQCVYIN